MRRVALVCPGRGSYTEPSLGSLPENDPLVIEAERLRADYDLEPLVALDSAGRFEPARHLRPANVSPLIYVCSMLDARQAEGSHRLVCVAGNSMGWYTALAVAGALSFADGFRLVQEMSLLQESGTPGGQVIYPQVDETWRPAAELQRSVERALEGEAVFPSIRLGGYAVLAGSEEGVARLLRELPRITLGKTTYPFRLAQHGPYHTPLASDVSDEARRGLAKLGFVRPRLPLIDGRGRMFEPVSAEVDELANYTLGDQVTTPYDFTASVRVALGELGPERIVLPGPGNTLGGICGQILIELGWRGIHSRDDFDRVQDSDRPVVESMRR